MDKIPARHLVKSFKWDPWPLGTFEEHYEVKTVSQSGHPPIQASKV